MNRGQALRGLYHLEFHPGAFRDGLFVFRAHLFAMEKQIRGSNSVDKAKSPISEGTRPAIPSSVNE